MSNYHRDVTTIVRHLNKIETLARSISDACECADIPDSVEKVENLDKAASHLFDAANSLEKAANRLRKIDDDT